MVAAAVVGSAVVGAGASIASGNKAAKAAEKGADRAADVQQHMYDTTRQDYAPYRAVGYSALDQLADASGVARPKSGSAAYAAGPGTTPAKVQPQTQWLPGGSFYGGINQPKPTTQPSKSPAMTTARGFETSPGYLFRLQEGQKAIERSAAARGGLNSGATMKALDRYSQGVASDEFSNYVARLQSLAGVGQSATGSTAAAGAQAAGGIAQAAQQAGAARASSYANTGAAINTAVGGIAGGLLYQQGLNSGAGMTGATVGYGGNLGSIY